MVEAVEAKVGFHTQVEPGARRDSVRPGIYPAAALAEAREIFVDLGKRAGDAWAEHRAAGLVREGQYTDTVVPVVLRDGTVVDADVKGIVSLNGGEDTLFVVDAETMVKALPKPDRRPL